MAAPIPTPIKAGEAYLRAIANDPASKAALMRAREYLQHIIDAINSPEFQRLLQAQEQVSQDWLERFRENIRRTNEALEAEHLPQPKTLEDWHVLGRIVEISEEYLQTGNWTPREIYDRAMAWVQREKIRAKLAADVHAERQARQAESVAETPMQTKAKRSTERGEGRAKLIAALTKHHQYAESGCLNLAPIGNNELARLAAVAKRTASAFFEKEFQGHVKYRSLCQDSALLAASLKALNGEFRPRDFYDVRSPDELDALGE